MRTLMVRGYVHHQTDTEVGERNTPETGRRLSATARVGKSVKHEECHKSRDAMTFCHKLSGVSDSLCPDTLRCNIPVTSSQCESAAPEHNDITADTNTPIGTDLQVQR
jgi:hypothetical protein